GVGGVLQRGCGGEGGRGERRGGLGFVVNDQNFPRFSHRSPHLSRVMPAPILAGLDCFCSSKWLSVPRRNGKNEVRAFTIGAIFDTDSAAMCFNDATSDR